MTLTDKTNGQTLTEPNFHPLDGLDPLTNNSNNQRRTGKETNPLDGLDPRLHFLVGALHSSLSFYFISLSLLNLLKLMSIKHQPSN